MRSWSSLLARVAMAGKTSEDDELITDFANEVVAEGHHVISYDPVLESVVVLSENAASHLREVLSEQACDLCSRIDAQLEVQELKRGT